MKLNHYPEYKDSGVIWLGKVPTHWAVIPNRGAFIEVNDQNHPHEEMLSVTISRGVIKQSTLLDDSSAKDGSRIDRSSYKLIKPGDIAYNKMRAWQGAIGVSTYRGIISPAYVVERPREGNDPDFLHYLLRTPAFAKEAERNSYGIASDMWSLRPEHFKTIRSCLPPPEEQAAIVRFLDHADEQIKSYIAGKERLIALLEEERQALVHQAVTRGLDPDVKLKHSGVEWLGDVPEHWEVRRLKSLASIGTGDKDTINRIQEGKYPFFVRSQHVERIDTWSFDGEAVLTAGDGVGVGKVFHHINGKFDFHQRVYKFSHFEDVLGRFFYHSLKASLPYHTQQGTAKSTVDSLRLPMLQNIGTPVPPIPEQTDIIEQLERSEKRIDTVVSEARRQIDLMNEYRTRLIADVVTGQLDVRDAAVNLP